ncbi:hypothetical protein [Bartonella raoultii]|uniref:hypothetical protein n=1 Tax=Bartonella raoultii TaxID=1457020 RepID=UPI001FF06C38
MINLYGAASHAFATIKLLAYGNDSKQTIIGSNNHRYDFVSRWIAVTTILTEQLLLLEKFGKKYGICLEILKSHRLSAGIMVLAALTGIVIVSKRFKEQRL